MKLTKYDYPCDAMGNRISRALPFTTAEHREFTGKVERKEAVGFFVTRRGGGSMAFPERGPKDYWRQP